ncbi:MAG: NADH-quinone oxidoreductase subunit A [Acidobacteriota bacterium]|nr:NADH-quinone oxidoreductase subunit A [Acidobacteriota bacterium]
MPQAHYPVLLALGIAFALGLVILALSALANRGVGGRVALSTYESGQPLLDQSRKRISILFFLIAIDFVIFDVEAAFLYPWVLVVREGGWSLFWAVLVFVALILVGLVYVWRRRSLDLLPQPGLDREKAGHV